MAHVYISPLFILILTALGGTRKRHDHLQISDLYLAFAGVRCALLTFGNPRQFRQNWRTV